MRITRIIALLLIIVLFTLTACTGTIIPPPSPIQKDFGEIEAQLKASQIRELELENQIKQLKEQYDIVGDTPVQTAQNIVKQYNQTHIYSIYDFFVCADMALDVWDMLKAHNINALIQVGNTQIGAKDITEADHAWVLAETSPGSYLALETTGGFAVWERDNALYYQGWSFDNPKEYKRFVELRQEYNLRLELSKEMWNTFETTRQSGLQATEAFTALVNEVSGMSMVNPALQTKLPELILKAKEIGELVGRCDQLTDLINDQKQQIDNIISEMKGLVS
jgi:hypothetical protein